MALIAQAAPSSRRSIRRYPHGELFLSHRYAVVKVRPGSACDTRETLAAVERLRWQRVFLEIPEQRSLLNTKSVFAYEPREGGIEPSSDKIFFSFCKVFCKRFRMTRSWTP